MAKMKKAQAGTALDSYKKAPKKSAAALTEMGRKTTRAAIDARTSKMADALDKQAGKGKYAPKPKGMNFDKKSFDKVSSLDKKIKKDAAPKQKMKNGGTLSAPKKDGLSMQLGTYTRQIGKNYTGKKVVNKGAKAKMGKSIGKCKNGC